MFAKSTFNIFKKTLTKELIYIYFDKVFTIKLDYVDATKMFSLSGVMILSIFCSSEKYLMTRQNVQLQLGTEGPPEVLRVHLGQLAGLPLRPPRHEAVPDNLVRPPEVTRPVPHTFTRGWS